MKRTLLTMGFVLAFAAPAMAATDLGEGACQQTDGQLGNWNGASSDDVDCITADEYAVLFAPNNLGQATDNGDGTHLIVVDQWTSYTVISDPLSRSTAVDNNPDAPTVGEAIFEGWAANGRVWN